MSPVITFRRKSGEATLVVRPYRRWSTVAVLGAVAISAALLLSVVLPSGDSTLRWVAAEALRAIAAATGLGAVLATAWFFVGREVITATPAALTIEHHIVLRRRRLTFPAHEVVSLRSVPGGQVMERGRPVTAVPALAFEHRGTVVRFAAGLAGPAAEQVVAALVAALEQPGRSASA